MLGFRLVHKILWVLHYLTLGTFILGVYLNTKQSYKLYISIPLCMKHQKCAKLANDLFTSCTIQRRKLRLHIKTWPMQYKEVGTTSTNPICQKKTHEST